MAVEPVPGQPAAIATTAGQRLLVIAEYHAGIEAVLRADGVELADGAAQRRERLVDLIAETAPDRLVILGDLTHAIGDPWDIEETELSALFEAIDLPVTLVKGNHDGEVEPVLEALDHGITTTAAGGVRIGEIGFAHGHTWPDAAVLEAGTLCIGHEHPTVRLTDEVGGQRFERVWLRGPIDPAAFEEYGKLPAAGAELIVFPAFNELSGGTWINADEQEFLSPFLPAALASGEAYLLDGTRLGAYRSL